MKAVGNGVIVKHKKEERKTSGGIVLTGVAMSTPHDTIESEVISCGSKVPDTLGLTVGKTILAQKHSMKKLSEDGDYIFSVLGFSEILAVVE